MAGHVEGLREIGEKRSATSDQRSACLEPELWGDWGRLILTLKEMIPDYNPSKKLLGRALESAAGGRRVGAVG